jgi:uncharacterized protein YciW
MSEKLYKMTVTDNFRSHDGRFFIDSRVADAVDVDGVIYASMFGGSFMTRADGDEWHQTESGAKLAAAEEIEKRLASVTAQVAKLREEAMEKVAA